MTPATIIAKMTADGLRLALTPVGTISARGDQAAVDRWLPIIREYKPGIVVALQETANDLHSVDPEAFEERAAMREYDGGYSRQDAELLAAWEMTQALFARLTAREWLARYAPERLPPGDKPENYPVAQIPPGNDFWLERERRAAGG
jgi:hypothetical protein